MSRQPDPVPSLLRRLAALERSVSSIAGSSPYYGTGIHPDGDGGMTVEGSLSVTTGEVSSGGYVPGMAGWHLGADGRAEFKDVTLYDLPNSMLAAPVLPGRVHGDAQNFACTVAWSTKITASITVPSGYTQALLVSVCSGATAYNSTAARDFLYVRTKVGGSLLGGWTIGSVDAAAGYTAVAYDFRTGLMTGLTPGSPLTFTSEISTAFGTWSANTSNVANLDVTILWLR